MNILAAVIMGIVGLIIGIPVLFFFGSIVVSIVLGTGVGLFAG